MAILRRDHLIWIGSAVFECSRLEAAIRDAIWRVLGVHGEDGLLATSRMDLATKIDLLRRLGLRYLRARRAQNDFLALLEAVEAQLEQRDILVSAQWLHLAQGDVVVPPPHRATGDPSYFASHRFPPEKLAVLTREARGSFARLQEAVKQIMALREQSEARRRLAEAKTP